MWPFRIHNVKRFTWKVKDSAVTEKSEKYIVTAHGNKSTYCSESLSLLKSNAQQVEFIIT